MVRGRKKIEKPEEDIEKVPKKRGRKPREEYYKDKQIETVDHEKNIILQLCVQLQDIPKNFTQEEKILKELPQQYSDGKNFSIPGYDGSALFKEIGEKNFLSIRNNLSPFKNDKEESSDILIQTPTFEKHPSKNVLNSTKESIDTVVYDLNVFPKEFSLNDVDKIKNIRLNIACWNCCHKFDNFPAYCPTNYNSKTKMFKTFGCFCSFNCVRRYVRNSKDTGYKNLDESLIAFLYKSMTGITQVIKMAANKECLNLFGGPFTIEQYRENFTNLTEYNLTHFPLIHTVQQILQKKNIKQPIQEIIVLSEKRVEEAKKRLLNLKKSELKENNDSSMNLEEIMGLTVK